MTKKKDKKERKFIIKYIYYLLDSCSKINNFNDLKKNKKINCHSEDDTYISLKKERKKERKNDLEDNLHLCPTPKRQDSIVLS